MNRAFVSLVAVGVLALSACSGGGYTEADRAACDRVIKTVFADEGPFRLEAALREEQDVARRAALLVDIVGAYVNLSNEAKDAAESATSGDVKDELRHLSRWAAGQVTGSGPSLGEDWRATCTEAAAGATSAS